MQSRHLSDGLAVGQPWPVGCSFSLVLTVARQGLEEHFSSFLQTFRSWQRPVDSADGGGKVCLQFSHKTLRQTLNTGLFCCLQDRKKNNAIRSLLVHPDYTSQEKNLFIQLTTMFKLLSSTCLIPLWVPADVQAHLSFQTWDENRGYAEHMVVVSDFFSRVVPHWFHYYNVTKSEVWEALWTQTRATENIWNFETFAKAKVTF